ncbi:hypothetical protein H312_01325 [Anncaliia algerae PRA339]|uniref:Uncharacterized protein n=1 Tax=Anncaliia algerae PRA339 TaxID=1288291 RepID=A0A059F2A6_9MICR|nr:hypothetical protein H312_01325 [Anncaliia algerae PRA339]
MKIIKEGVKVLFFVLCIFLLWLHNYLAFGCFLLVPYACGNKVTFSIVTVIYASTITFDKFGKKHEIGMLQNYLNKEVVRKEKDIRIQREYYDFSNCEFPEEYLQYDIDAPNQEIKDDKNETSNPIGDKFVDDEKNVK